MREIKFKAWHKKLETMYDVAAIDFRNKEITLSRGNNVLFDCDLSEVKLIQDTESKDKNSEFKLKELREDLELYDGEMQVVVLDEERNAHELKGITLDYRDKEPVLALKFNSKE